MATLSLPFAGTWGPPPTFPVIQRYGPTTVQNEPLVAGVRFHFGLDFGMPIGTPILAMMGGTVTTAGRDPYGYKFPSADGIGGFGNVVYIDHGDGTGAYYGHNSQILVAPNQTVVRGQVIARSGMSGNSGGVPHLHAQANRGVGYSPTDITPLLSGAAGIVQGPAVPVLTQPGGTLTYNDAIYYARRAGIPEGQLAICIAIARAESGLDPRALNTNNSDGSVDRGLWQVNSVHCQPRGPYVADALFDPTYNAQAMATISSHGTAWGQWTTYSGAGYVGPPKYLQYLDAAKRAVAATPLGYTPTYSTASSGASAGPAAGTDPLAALATPADTTAQEPVIQIDVVPVTPRLDLFASVPNKKDTALVWIAGHYMFTTGLSFSVSEYYAPGDFASAFWLGHVPQEVRDALRAREFTQVVIYGGFVDEVPAVVDQLLPLWSGVAQTPKRDFDAGTIDISGPDYSGVFSNNNATTSDLSQFANATGAQIVTALVAGHNKKGQPGLAVVTDASAVTGQAFGSNIISTRQSATTEWQTMLGAARNEAKTLYWEGATLYYQDLPREPSPLYLNYRVQGEDSLLAGLVISDQPHAKRDTRIEVTSYSSADGTAWPPAVAGNHDATTVVKDILPPNSSQDACQRRADSLARIYGATEYTMDCAIHGIVPLARGQAIIIESDDPDVREYTGQRWYASKRRYTFDAQGGGGWTMALTCTSRPFASVGKASASSSALGGF